MPPKIVGMHFLHACFIINLFLYESAENAQSAKGLVDSFPPYAVPSGYLQAPFRQPNYAEIPISCCLSGCPFPLGQSENVGMYFSVKQAVSLVCNEYISGIIRDCTS